MSHHEYHVTASMYSMTVVRITFKGISDNHGWLHPQLMRIGAVLPYHPFGCSEKEIKKMVTSYYSLGWNTSCKPESKRSGVGVGVDIFSPESESESELLKIRQLRSPGSDGVIRRHVASALQTGELFTGH